MKQEWREGKAGEITKGQEQTLENIFIIIIVMFHECRYMLKLIKLYT